MYQGLRRSQPSAGRALAGQRCRRTAVGEPRGVWHMVREGTERIHLLKIREIDSLRIVAAALVNRDQAFSFESLEGGPHRDSTDAKTRCKFFLHEPLFAKPPG